RCDLLGRDHDQHRFICVQSVPDERRRPIDELGRARVEERLVPETTRSVHGAELLRGGHAHAITRLPIRASYGQVGNGLPFFVGRWTIRPCRSWGDMVLEFMTARWG